MSTATSKTASAMAKAPNEPRPFGRAILWLVILGALFFSTYNFANWLASTRPGVPIFVFDWERHIPFLPWTILPYWSIDLLYGVSVLLCATRAEIAVHVKRLLAAQVISIVCFIAFPLRFSFDRPPVDGLFGAMFDALGAFDKPFNQAPSLHMSLLVIIWARLLVHTHAPWLRAILHAWMALIGVSVLTTYQHHFIDLPTGVAVGFLCLWLWPEQGRSPVASFAVTRDPRRRQLALRYGLGAIACAAVATLAAGTWLWLYWLTLALGMVALNYFALGEAGFQKRADGRLSMASRWLLAPYLAGAWINSRAWTRNDPAPRPVHDDVWIGRIPAGDDLARSPFTGVVDLTAELSLDPAARDYASHPVLDLTVPSKATLAQAAQSIERLRSRGPVLVCCALGYSRSAAAVSAWLLATGRARSVDEAASAVSAARPRVVLSEAHRRALQAVAP